MVSIIIPAHNEERYIENVLKNIPEGHEVIIIDDGSIDNTSRVVKKYGHKIIRLDKKRGKGFACLSGAKQSSHEHCIFIDGDSQLDAKEIPKFIRAIKKADIVIGQRQLKDIPFHRKISNRFARWCVNYLTDNNFSDVLCGFRAVKRGKLLGMKFRKLGYFFESELILEAAKNGLKIETVPVSVDYNTGSRMPFTKSIKVATWLMKNVIKKSVGMYN